MDLQIDVASWMPSAYQRLTDTLAPALGRRPCTVFVTTRSLTWPPPSSWTPNASAHCGKAPTGRVGPACPPRSSMRCSTPACPPIRSPSQPRTGTGWQTPSGRRRANVIPAQGTGRRRRPRGQRVTGSRGGPAARRGSGQRAASLGDLLARASLPDAGRRTFAKLVAQRPQEGEAFWNTVRRELDLSPARLSELRTLLDVGALSGGFRPWSTGCCASRCVRASGTSLTSPRTTGRRSYATPECRRRYCPAPTSVAVSRSTPTNCTEAWRSAAPRRCSRPASGRTPCRSASGSGRTSSGSSPRTPSSSSTSTTSRAFSPRTGGADLRVPGSSLAQLRNPCCDSTG